MTTAPGFGGRALAVFGSEADREAFDAAVARAGGMHAVRVKQLPGNNGIVVVVAGDVAFSGERALCVGTDVVCALSAGEGGNASDARIESVGVFSERLVLRQCLYCPATP